MAEIIRALRRSSGIRGEQLKTAFLVQIINFENPS